VVLKENSVAKYIFKSIGDPGGNIVRIRINPIPYSSNYKARCAEEDSGSPEKLELQKENTAGLKILFTFKYQSLEIENAPNFYDTRLAWQSIANNVDQLKENPHVYGYKQTKNDFEPL
jgi:arabinogalactan endo-1,4-beta-galactosidase